MRTNNRTRPAKSLGRPVRPVEVDAGRSVSRLLADMKRTGFQGRSLGEALHVWARMASDRNVALLVGLAGSGAVAGQHTILQWMIANGFVDVLVTTGANICEDIVDAMGHPYRQCDREGDDEQLFVTGWNRYYDVCGREEDYLRMTELIAGFVETLDEKHGYTSREFLGLFGHWLHARGLRSIASIAAVADVPIFCPALTDSPYGDAALIAGSHGFHLVLDSVKDYDEFMSLAARVRSTGVVYIGGGVPKDFIQLFAVSGNLRYQERRIPTREAARVRDDPAETYYPHKYAIQITTDSAQWGGLSGATLREGVSWGKATRSTRLVECHCDATIALPLLSQGLAELLPKGRRLRRLAREFG